GALGGIWCGGVRSVSPGLDEVHIGGENAAVVGAVIEDALVSDGVAENVGVESPEVRARCTVGGKKGGDERLHGEVPGTGRAVTDRDANGAVATAGVRPTARRGRLGDGDE